MALKNLVHVDSGLLFQIVDVLCHAHFQNVQFVDHLDEVVGRCRFILRQVKVSSTELIESFRFGKEIIQSEESFRVRQIVLLKVCVNASFGRTEIWDTG
jgi:hypothetical protein